jgi:hypothetical protein
MYSHACGCVSTCTWLYIYMHVAMYPRAHGCVSMCMWPCINVVTYPHTCGRVSLPEFGYAVYATVQNLAQHCWPLCRILLSTLDHGAESLTTAQNRRKFIETLTIIFSPYFAWPRTKKASFALTPYYSKSHNYHNFFLNTYFSTWVFWILHNFFNAIIWLVF